VALVTLSDLTSPPQDAPVTPRAPASVELPVTREGLLSAAALVTQGLESQPRRPVMAPVTPSVPASVHRCDFEGSYQACPVLSGLSPWRRPGTR
jgi:hypothetical protein